METVAQLYDYVVGVDTHSKTHTYALIDAKSKALGVREYKTSISSISKAINWISKYTKGGKVLFSIEGTSSYGEILTVELTKANYDVVEAKPIKTKSRQNEGKTDQIDAFYAARSIQHKTKDELVYPKRQSEIKALKVLLAIRKNMVKQNSADKNTVLSILRTTNLKINPTRITNKLLYQCLDMTGKDELENIIIGSVKVLAKKIIDTNKILVENEKQMQSIIKKVSPILLEQKGIGPICAGTILYTYSHKGRFKSADAFVKTGGLCPIPASSGDNIRYRLSRYGDRRLNSCFSTIATWKMIHDEQTIAYVEKRTKKGKNKKEIKRVLKRYLARSVFRLLESENIGVCVG
jgi:transposase